jgi:hypothetical protein
MEARAVWDFGGSQPGDLTFRSGEIIAITNTGIDFTANAPTTPKDGVGPKAGWWMVRFG